MMHANRMWSGWALSLLVHTGVAFGWTPDAGFPMWANSPTLGACTAFNDWKSDLDKLVDARGQPVEHLESDPWMVVQHAEEIRICRVCSEPDGLTAEQRLRMQLPDDSWLIAEYGGEWGSELWWQPKRSGVRVRLAKMDVVRMIPSLAGLQLVVVGVPSNTLPRGEVYRVDIDSHSPPKLMRLIEFRGYPYASVPDPNGFIHVATGDSLITVDISATTVKWRDDVPWAGGLGVTDKDGVVLALRPNSLGYSDKGFMLIGTQAGVVRVPLQEGSAAPDWITYSDSSGADCGSR